MGTYTTNYNLYMPTVGEQSWGTLVNGNFTTIDTTMKSLSNRITAVENEVNGALSCTSVTTSGKITGNGGIAGTTGTFSGAVTATSFNGIAINKTTPIVLTATYVGDYIPNSGRSSTRIDDASFNILPYIPNILYTGSFTTDMGSSGYSLSVNVLNENNTSTVYSCNGSSMTISFSRCKRIDVFGSYWYTEKFPIFNLSFP